MQAPVRNPRPSRRARRAAARAGKAGSSVRSSDRWWFVALAIAIAALAIRIAYFAQIRHTPFWDVLFGDAEQYDAWALRIAGGDWLGQGVFYQTPLYPYWLGSIYAVVGHNLAIVRLLQAGLDATSCVLLAYAGRVWFGRTAGLIAGGLLAVCPEAIFADGLIQKSALDLFLMTGVLAALAAWTARRQAWLVAVTGLAMGLLALNRENALVLTIIIPAWLVWSERGRPMAARGTLVALGAAGFLAATAPVAIRNYAVSGEFVLSTSQAGPNFYIGNHRGASGGYEPLLPGRDNPKFERSDATVLAEQAAGRHLSATEVSRYWLTRAFDDIRSDPAGWLRLLGRKLLLTLNAREMVDSESLREYAMHAWTLRALSWISFGALLVAAVFGIAIRRDTSLAPVLLYAIGASLLVAVATFFVFSRYRYPVVAVLILLAAAGIDTARRIRLPSRTLAIAAAVTTVTAVVTYLPLVHVGTETHFNVAVQLERLGRSAEAVPYMARAVAMAPDDLVARLRLGGLRVEAGDLDQGIADLSAVVTAQPASAQAHAALARAYDVKGAADASLREWQTVVALPGAPASARVNFGMKLWNAGRKAEAIEQYRSAIAQEPRDAVAHNNLGLALQQSGKDDDARAEYERALALNPTYAEAHGNLAALLLAREDEAEALPHAAAAVRYKSNDYGLLANYGDVLMHAKRLREASEEYRKALQYAPDSADVVLSLLERLVPAEAGDGEIDQARADLDRALQLAQAASLQAEVARLKQLRQQLDR